MDSKSIKLMVSMQMLAGEGGLLQICVASIYSRPAILLVVRLYKWYVVKMLSL